MSLERVFVTGATGCVGQYLVDALASRRDVEVHALVRPGSALEPPADASATFVTHEGALEAIDDHVETVRRCDAIIHLAAAWDDSPRAELVNVDRTLEMVAACDPSRCRRVIAVSTASVLAADNSLLPEALVHGTAYVRSKHLACRRLADSPVADRLVTFFPTLIFGGDATHRWSHVARELAQAERYLWLARFFRAEGCFHFIHARDLAAMIVRVLEEGSPAPRVVPGQPATSFDEALAAICQVRGWRYRGTLALTPPRVLAGARLLGARLSAWDRYAIEHPRFEYRVTRPEDLGLTSAYPTIRSVLAALANHTRSDSQAVEGKSHPG